MGDSVRQDRLFEIATQPSCLGDTLTISLYQPDANKKWRFCIYKPSELGFNSKMSEGECWKRFCRTDKFTNVQSAEDRSRTDTGFKPRLILSQTNAAAEDAF